MKQSTWYTLSCARRTTELGAIPSPQPEHLVPYFLKKSSLQNTSLFFTKHLSRSGWAQAAQPGVYPPSALSPFNLLPRQHELSHHLAHAWSVLAQCPFDDGLIVVMDGMGETLAAMATAGADDAYTHDLQLPAHASGFAQVPAAPAAHVQYREAESAYAFEGRQLTRVFKRWAAHRSPPELYNFGFENLESLGAVYSRVSSHTFGDWNLCGKVMGLAPWADALGAPPAPPLIRGATDDGLRVDWAALDALPCTNSWGEEDAFVNVRI